jgi:hypothetical protein
MAGLQSRTTEPHEGVQEYGGLIHDGWQARGGRDGYKRK